MRILHTESSTGWGGQEIRILKEALEMRKRGHDIFFVVAKGAVLATKAKEALFSSVEEVCFHKSHLFSTVWFLKKFIQQQQIDIVNTHSSLDSWMGGLAGRLNGRKIIRTRHLSTPIRKGLNSVLLYRSLADFVATTSSSIIPMIVGQAKMSKSRCRCVPTGVIPEELSVLPEEVLAWRLQHGFTERDIVVGTACFVRSWKGIQDFLRAAQILKERADIKWVVVGGGYVKDYATLAEQMGLKEKVLFTGHLASPYVAIRGMDIFTLLSTAHEGISQASLQAAYLERPLVTTSIGGLSEVCLEGETGILVPPHCPERVAKAVLQLAADSSQRVLFGKQGARLVREKFLFQQTADQMEQIYKEV